MYITVIRPCFIFNCDNDFAHLLLKLAQFPVYYYYEHGKLLRESCVPPIHELRNSLHTQRCQSSIRRVSTAESIRYIPASLDAGLDIRPYFVDPGSGLPESI